MRKIRLFLAVNLPDEVKKNISGLRESLANVPLDSTWVKEENLHLTIKFFGEVNVDLVSAIVATIQSATAAIVPFQISFSGLGYFPNSKRPRIFWAGIKGQVNELVDLHKKLELALSPLGFPPEGRSYSPHLTIFRLRSQRGVGLLKKVVGKKNKENIELGNLTVNSVELMQSQLTPRGPVYTVIDSFRLLGM
ncbi:MAG TPA: RNA 2',3'-cyclic phosphodiesterase [Clostridia bacterium]|nr:RNA 2',3'-cyclic phosphodiesterase [Clostridia bacterium]